MCDSTLTGWLCPAQFCEIVPAETGAVPIRYFLATLLAAPADMTSLLAAHHDLPILLTATSIHTLLLAGRANRAMQPAV